jgi:hypothetical protein
LASKPIEQKVREEEEETEMGKLAQKRSRDLSDCQVDYHRMHFTP